MILTENLKAMDYTMRQTVCFTFSSERQSAAHYGLPAE